MEEPTTKRSYTAVRNVGLSLSATTAPLNGNKSFLKNISSVRKHFKGSSQPNCLLLEVI
jgi:hypothetical protein